jgi:hypothetical protein
MYLSALVSASNVLQAAPLQSPMVVLELAAPPSLLHPSLR